MGEFFLSLEKGRSFFASLASVAKLCRRRKTSNNNLRFATRTIPTAWHFPCELKDGFLFIFVTIGTNPVRRLNGWLGFIERIYKTSQPSSNIFKMITSPFLVPIFLLNELLFQVFFRAQNVLIVRLNHHHFGLKVEDNALKLYCNLVDFDFFACVRKSFRCAGYRRDKSNRLGKFDCHNAGINPQNPPQVNQTIDASTPLSESLESCSTVQNSSKIQKSLLQRAADCFRL